MVVLVTYKNKEEPIKNESASSSYNPMGAICFHGNQTALIRSGSKLNAANLQ